MFQQAVALLGYLGHQRPVRPASVMLLLQLTTGATTINVIKMTTTYRGTVVVHNPGSGLSAHMEFVDGGAGMLGGLMTTGKNRAQHQASTPLCQSRHARAISLLLVGDSSVHEGLQLGKGHKQHFCSWCVDIPAMLHGNFGTFTLSYCPLDNFHNLSAVGSSSTGES